MRQQIAQFLQYLREMPVEDRQILFQEVKKFLKTGATYSIGDEFAIKHFLLTPLFLSQLNSDQEHMAAYGLTTTTINVLFIVADYYSGGSLSATRLQSRHIIP